MEYLLTLFNLAQQKKLYGIPSIPAEEQSDDR